MNEIITHALINRDMCGTPVEVSQNNAVITMTTKEYMAVDRQGLVHGGFIFGLADHAAMLAVNHPNVVLAGAEVRFKKPVVVGDLLNARGQVTAESGIRRTVSVIVQRGTETVFEGTFACVVLENHVLENIK